MNNQFDSDDGILLSNDKKIVFNTLIFIKNQDMQLYCQGLYLSLNQGVTEVKENYKRDSRNVLRMRAQDYRARLDYHDDELLETDSNSVLLFANNTN